MLSRILMTGYDTDTPPLLHNPSPRCVDGGLARVFLFFAFLFLVLCSVFLPSKLPIYFSLFYSAPVFIAPSSARIPLVVCVRIVRLCAGHVVLLMVVRGMACDRDGEEREGEGGRRMEEQWRKWATPRPKGAGVIFPPKGNRERGRAVLETDCAIKVVVAAGAAGAGFASLFHLLALVFLPL